MAFWGWKMGLVFIVGRRVLSWEFGGLESFPEKFETSSNIYQHDKTQSTKSPAGPRKFVRADSAPCWTSHLLRSKGPTSDVALGQVATLRHWLTAGDTCAVLARKGGYFHRPFRLCHAGVWTRFDQTSVVLGSCSLKSWHVWKLQGWVRQLGAARFRWWRQVAWWAQMARFRAENRKIQTKTN